MNKLVKLTKLTWQKGVYTKPQPLPRNRSFWIALGVVSLLVLAYCVYFCILLTTKQDAFKTNGEDMGIMDQAIWSFLHGSMFHQTICNSLTDTNCYGLDGVNRFAIHYEPILFPISLLYLIWPDPKALLIFQVLVVASGAFPAFLLARLRLRNSWAGIPFAFLFLLYPAQQYAVNFDFHPVTLTAALLLFVLYFTYTRRTVWLFVFAILSLACKEELAGIIAMVGLWTLVFQGRWRVGLGLIVVALAWMGVGLLIVHYASPVGKSMLASRYSYLGNGPVDMALNVLLHPRSIIKDHIFEPSHFAYIRRLLTPSGGLPLLAPWILVIAAPTLALNLFSNTPNMYSGHFQYSAEIVPILVFSAIEGVVVLMWVLRWALRRLKIERDEVQPELATKSQPLATSKPSLSLSLLLRVGALTLLLCYIVACVSISTRKYDTYSAMFYTNGFIWPSVTSHNKLASRFLDQIPADASVSTQTSLIPHLSQRKNVYLFPYAIGHADYILLDATGYRYPFKGYDAYAATVQSTLQGGNYGLVDLEDGFILMKRGAPVKDFTPALKMIEKYAPPPLTPTPPEQTPPSNTGLIRQSSSQ
ncbi:DUF2079 domain-containing protein [Ktedonospora formicarum]|uniref:DUF2079 domain-containing protein n=1 Tax=Ktedonospora formicarum TaxID=2778364 RepID=A0A8J3MQ35_9CHLR|nr:DUF2079 domain-containing protein [Ktedonospora formicarum]GHO44457.1 hypothetical protein KSX_26200 [Ktedonospora formicarum]